MEAAQGKEDRLRELFADYGLELIEIGEVDDDSELQIETEDGELEWSLDELKDAWLNGLPRALR